MCFTRNLCSLIPEEFGRKHLPNVVAYTVALQALQVAGPRWTVAAGRLAKQMGGAQDVVSCPTSLGIPGLEGEILPQITW